MRCFLNSIPSVDRTITRSVSIPPHIVKTSSTFVRAVAQSFFAAFGDKEKREEARAPRAPSRGLQPLATLLLPDLATPPHLTFF
jgi:hypothetical protein